MRKKAVEYLYESLISCCVSASLLVNTKCVSYLADEAKIRTLITIEYLVEIQCTLRSKRVLSLGSTLNYF